MLRTERQRLVGAFTMLIGGAVIILITPLISSGTITGLALTAGGLALWHRFETTVTQRQEDQDGRPSHDHN